MANKTEIFENAAVLVPSRSGFDMSHENLFTTKCGTLTPCMVQNLLPNSTVSLNTSFIASLPPLATDFFGRVDICLEAFFCPYRLCYGGWDEFITQTLGRHTPSTTALSIASTVDTKSTSNPLDRASSSSSGSSADGYANLRGNETASAYGSDTNPYSSFVTPICETLPHCLAVNRQAYFGDGTLADYLGYKIANATTTSQNFPITNLLPFIAYHRIAESYYRDSLKEKPYFLNPAGDVTATYNDIKYVPYVRYSSSSAIPSTSMTLNDGTNVCALRQRKYSRDYFTTATPVGSAPNDSTRGARLSLWGLNEDGEDAVVNNISIQQLRVANTLQQFLDRNNASAGGTKYRDAIYTRFGITPHTCCTDPIFLGSARVPLYNNSVQTTTPSATYAGTAGSTINTGSQPWKGAGSKIASPATSSDSTPLIDNFTTREHGIIMVMFSLVPHAYYGSGISKFNLYTYASDFADALFQNCGDQAIYNDEISLATDNRYKFEVFGYTIPYAEQCYHNDEVHGLFRYSGTMKNFVLQRVFNSSNAIPYANVGFETIGTTDMDDVCATDAKVSDYGVQCDMLHRLKVVQPLAKFVIPTLGTPEFMHAEKVSRGGTRLS